MRMIMLLGLIMLLLEYPFRSGFSADLKRNISGMVDMNLTLKLRNVISNEEEINPAQRLNEQWRAK